MKVVMKVRLLSAIYLHCAWLMTILTWDDSFSLSQLFAQLSSCLQCCKYQLSSVLPGQELCHNIGTNTYIQRHYGNLVDVMNNVINSWTANSFCHIKWLYKTFFTPIYGGSSNKKVLDCMKRQERVTKVFYCDRLFIIYNYRWQSFNCDNI